MKKENRLLTWLVAASALASLLAISRYYFSDNLRFTFLIWNLFLAWVPVGFAHLASQQLVGGVALYKRPFALLFSTLWLLFFPNAPYILTDFIHLRPMKHTPLWFDALMIATFALTGLLLGFLSLRWMQTAVQRQYGRVVGWLFALLALLLASFGVYMGRFWRWNSWDMLLQPTAVLTHLTQTLTDPTHAQHTATITMTLTIILIISYALFRFPQKKKRLED